MKEWEFVETKEWCKKLLAKTGYVLAQEKLCQQFNQDTGSNRDPGCVFLVSRKIQDRVRWGGGEAGKGAGLRNRVSWQESRHRKDFSRLTPGPKIEVSII
jgi:hypothetical protein